MKECNNRHAGIKPSYDTILKTSLLLCFAFFTALNSFSQLLLQQKQATRIPSFITYHQLPVTLGYFDQKDIPDSLDGCSEQYAFDTLSFHIHKMVLFTDLNTTALLKINGKLLRFTITDTEIKGKKYTLHFSGHGYNIQFISLEVKKLDMEYWIRSGTLEIIKGNQKKTFQVLGYYGC